MGGSCTGALHLSGDAGTAAQPEAMMKCNCSQTDFIITLAVSHWGALLMCAEDELTELCIHFT